MSNIFDMVAPSPQGPIVEYENRDRGALNSATHIPIQMDSCPLMTYAEETVIGSLSLLPVIPTLL